MALLPLRQATANGADPQLQAADVGGDTAAAGGPSYLLFRNTGVAARTATIQSFYTPEPGASPQNVVIALPAGATRVMGPLSRYVHLRDPEGLVQISYDNNADVTVAHVGSN